ncbi:hypothetical protein ACN47E_005953 [Coniothyrium glycines]
MTSSQTWQLLPSELIELQLGHIDLLLAMYLEDIVLDEATQRLVDQLRSLCDGEAVLQLPGAPIVSCTLHLPIGVNAADAKYLHLDLAFPFTLPDGARVDEPPPAKVRVRQPAWLSKAATTQLMLNAPNEADLLGTIEHIKEAAAEQIALAAYKTTSTDSEATRPLVRVWFYFPSISTRSKRDDFIIHAPSYHLTGFLYAGKPGLLCVEGESQQIDDYMKWIKTESWGDIPAHHKKVSERYRENITERVFSDMTETTDSVGERRGQRANRGDMKAMEEWLVERGLGDAFTKVLM